MHTADSVEGHEVLLKHGAQLEGCYIILEGNFQRIPPEAEKLSSDKKNLPKEQPQGLFGGFGQGSELVKC